MSRPIRVIRIHCYPVLIASLLLAILLGVFGHESLAQSGPALQEHDRTSNRPGAAQQYESLRKELQRLKPGVENARQHSNSLRAQAETLRRKLVETAARIQYLEERKAQIESEIRQLTSREAAMSAKFARDRVRLSHLVAVLERLQVDLPPPIALEPKDALAAARGAMVLGASLPEMYRQAAAVRRTLDSLHATRANLVARREESIRNAKSLAAAHHQLDQLLATKAQEATRASAEYEELEKNLAAISAQAIDLKTLLDRVASLRTATPKQGPAAIAGDLLSLRRPETLLKPIVGPIVQGGPDALGGASAPGLSFVASPGASVVAPADSQVLFAGRYHKSGQVLILEISDGYDLVLAGLDRIDVRAGDQLLTGEPVGRMPLTGNGAKLYFELRQNGKGVSPARWLGVDLKRARRS